MGLSSLTRDWTCDPCSGSMKSLLWIAKEVWQLLTRIWLSQNCAFFRHLSQWPLPMGLVLASLTNVPLGCGTCSLRMADAGSACPWSLCLLGLCGSPKCREHEGRRAQGGHAKKDRAPVPRPLRCLHSENSGVLCSHLQRRRGVWVGVRQYRNGIEAAHGWP